MLWRNFSVFGEEIIEDNNSYKLVILKSIMESLSFTGRFLFNFENQICKNFKLFIGKHEKTVEIAFLVIYVIIQIILAIIVLNAIVAILIISFLFFLALERIFVHIWLDYERELLKKKEDEIKNNFYNFRNFANKEIYNLKSKLNK